MAWMLDNHNSRDPRPLDAIDFNKGKDEVARIETFLVLSRSDPSKSGHRGRRVTPRHEISTQVYGTWGEYSRSSSPNITPAACLDGLLCAQSNGWLGYTQRIL
jgi:hypothetical protein